MGALIIGIVAIVAVLALTWFLVPSTKDGHTDKPKKDGKTGTAGGGQIREDAHRLPYRYADNRIFVHGDSVWTGVRLTTHPEELASADELTAMATEPGRVFAALGRSDRPVEWHLKIVEKPVDAPAETARIVDAAWLPTRNYRAYVERIAEYQQRLGASEREVVLFVKLGSLTHGPTVSLGETSAEVPRPRSGEKAGLTARAGELVTGVSEEDLAPATIERWQAVAASVHQAFGRLGEPLSRADLVYHIRKPLYGHLPVPKEPVIRSRAWGRSQFDLVVDFRGDNSRPTHIEIEQVDEETGQQLVSYATTLVVASWPESMRFQQYQAWARRVGELDFPVDVSWRGTLLPAQQFSKEIVKIHNNLKDEYEDMVAGGRTPDQQLTGQVAVSKEAVDAAVDDPRPGFEGRMRFAVSAPTVEELNRRTSELKKHLERQAGVEVLRAKRLQWRLIQEALPGDEPKVPIAPYQRIQSLETFGVGLPTAGVNIGDRTSRDRSGHVLGWKGPFIGWSGRFPVHYALHVGPARNMGAGVACAGASGGGKSSLGLLKFWQESEAGTECVAIDPKVDFAQMCYYLAFGAQVNDPEFEREAAEGTIGTAYSKFQPVNAEFWAETRVIDLLKSHDGVLDPWAITPDVHAGRLVAETMFAGFIGQQMWQRVQVPVTVAMETVVDRYDQRLQALMAQGAGAALAAASAPRPTAWEVVQDIEDQLAAARDDATSRADKLAELELAVTVLKSLRKMPYARLAFAKEPRPFEATRRRRTVITLRGLELPQDDNPDNWQAPDRLASTILQMVMRMASQMLDVKLEQHPVTGLMAIRPKALFVDESYVVTATPAGRSLLQRALKQGRSYAMVVYLITQQVADLIRIEDAEAREGGTNQIHSAFMFLQKSVEEARRVAPMLKRDPDDPRVTASLMEPHLETGVCMYRDADNRVGTTEIDLVFMELLRATDTNPKTRPSRQAVDPPADVALWSFQTDMGDLEVAA
ncbi:MULTISPECIES: ATP-binding protein [unclassified Streptomyces]|uniref:ATP-binding protein n=1 Tax=unclassified Streptomyces TaxID=2593676 RepID=UPI0037A2287D